MYEAGARRADDPFLHGERSQQRVFASHRESVGPLVNKAAAASAILDVAGAASLAATAASLIPASVIRAVPAGAARTVATAASAILVVAGVASLVATAASASVILAVAGAAGWVATAAHRAFRALAWLAARQPFVNWVEPESRA